MTVPPGLSVIVGQNPVITGVLAHDDPRSPYRGAGVVTEAIHRTATAIADRNPRERDGGTASHARAEGLLRRVRGMRCQETCVIASTLSNWVAPPPNECPATSERVPLAKVLPLRVSVPAPDAPPLSDKPPPPRQSPQHAGNSFSL